MLRDGQSAGDDALLMRIADGDREAFRLLMDRHVRKLLVMAERITGSAEDANDVVQDAFLKVWRLAANWRPDGEAQFSTWIYRVAFNLCIDRKRAKPMEELDAAGEIADLSPDGADHALASERKSLLAGAMEELPLRQREALALYYFAEVSGPEAARSLGISIAAMEALLVRARRGLKDALSRRGLKNFGDLS